MAEETHNRDMSDEPDRQHLENRIDELEQAVAKMLPSRRDALKLGGAALVGGAAMSGTASAGNESEGTIGTSGSPVDIESEDINNADTMTTQDLVVNGTATGPFGADLQGCRVNLSSDQEISGRELIQFDDVVYDSGNNFDTSTHGFTCPTDGLYIASGQANFKRGGGGQRRRVFIGNLSTATPNGEGSVVVDRNSNNKDILGLTTVNKYAQGDTIAMYARNRDSTDDLGSGRNNFGTNLEVAFLGSL